jgi:transcriptional regulator with XRE-family HTH domain
MVRHTPEEDERRRTLGARLRAARLAGGRTLSQVGQLNGLTAAQVCNVEHGRRGGAAELLAKLVPAGAAAPPSAPMPTIGAGGSIYRGVAHHARKELLTKGLRAGFVSEGEVATLVREYQLDEGMMHALVESLRMMGIEIHAAARTG